MLSSMITVQGSARKPSHAALVGNTLRSLENQKIAGGLDQIDNVSVSQGIIDVGHLPYKKRQDFVLSKPKQEEIFNEQNENSKIGSTATLLDFCCKLFLSSDFCG